MKFTRELPGTLTVRSVSPAGIQINEDLWPGSVGVTPDVVLENWPEKPIADLTHDDFSAVLELEPELVIVGTGSSNEFPPRELVFAFARSGVGLEVMDTAAAARTFNVLAGEGRRVAAILYLPR